MSETITIVAKGPSANHAQEFIDACPGTHIAAINDAGDLFTNHINWVFLSDSDVARKIAHFKSRTDVFAFPENRILSEGKSISEWLGDTEKVQYPCEPCAGDETTLRQRITEGGITHHNTVNGALHWLCKHGKYRTIRLIGVDGGREYADGRVFSGSPQAFKRLAESHGTEDFLDIWHDITDRLIDILKCTYAVEVNWYGH